MELLFAISTGVISGVVSAGLLFFTRTLIVGHLIPWYHQLLYRGINVDGDWHASGFQMLQDFKLVIKQRAGLITGSAEFLRRDGQTSDLEDSREFDVEGRIQDRYITLTLSHKNRQRIGVVSLLLEPVCDGRELRGQMAFVSIRSSAIDAVEIHLARDKSVVVAERQQIEAEMKRMFDESTRQGELPLKRSRSRKANRGAPDQVEPEPAKQDDLEDSVGPPGSGVSPVEIQ